MQLDLDATDARITISVPQQGLQLLELSSQDFSKWAQEEADLWGIIQKLAQTNFSLSEHQAYGSLDVEAEGHNLLTQLRNKFDAGDVESGKKLLESYLEPARKFKRIVSGGYIAKRLKEYLAEGETFSAQVLLATFSDDVGFKSGGPTRFISALKTVALNGPYALEQVNTVEAEAANSASHEAYRLITNELESVRAQSQKQSSDITNLEDLYRTKLQIETPAKNWEAVVAARNFQWRVWLAFFCVAAAAPFCLVLLFYPTVAELLKLIVPQNGASVSLAGLAVVTAPVLFYAWLLRQMSRILTRSFDLSVDAAHRRALAVTYLGLAENPKLNIDIADRALILQALFRPQPPHVTEDGPPMGLMDLINAGKGDR